MAKALAWGFIYAIIISGSIAIVVALNMMLVHEYTRWYECEQHCIDRYINNENLIMSKVCSADSSYGESIRSECKRAIQENKLTQFQCQSRAFWRESELNRLYSMYTESHWMLFGLGSAGVISFVIGFFTWCMGCGYQRKKEEKKTISKDNESLELHREFTTVMREGIEAIRKNSAEQFKFQPPTQCITSGEDVNFVHGQTRKRHRPLVLKKTFTQQQHPHGEDSDD